MGALAKTTITGNEATDAFDLSLIASDAAYLVTGATGGTVTPQYSNKRGTKVDADWSSAAAITSFPSGPWQLPFGIAKFVRFKGTGVVGTAIVTWGPVKDGDGRVTDVSTEFIHTAQVTA